MSTRETRHRQMLEDMGYFEVRADYADAQPFEFDLKKLADAGLEVHGETTTYEEVLVSVPIRGWRLLWWRLKRWVGRS